MEGMSEGTHDGRQDEATDGSEGPEATATEAPDAAGLEQARQDLAALNDRHLRLAAEFDNYRKRTERERREVTERAAAAILEELLLIVDDFERALGADAAADPAAYRDGVQIIHRQLMELLLRRGVQPIEAVGADFDPEWHQAVAYDPAPGHRDGEILEEMRRGYRLGDRLLRPSMVRVAKA
jgi:molecular chaperone GrpE